MVPGEIPCPLSLPHEVAASPRLDDSSIFPSSPTARVPTPSSGRKDQELMVQCPTFVATKVTVPAPMEFGDALSDTIIQLPPPIIAPSRSLDAT